MHSVKAIILIEKTSILVACSHIKAYFENTQRGQYIGNRIGLGVYNLRPEERRIYERVRLGYFPKQLKRRTDILGTITYVRMHEHISKIPKILLEQMQEVLKKKITITLYCPNCQGAKIKKNGKKRSAGRIICAGTADDSLQATAL